MSRPSHIGYDLSEVKDWDNSLSYNSGDYVRYWGNYFRAVRDIDAPWLPSIMPGEVPGKSDAWRPVGPPTVSGSDRGPKEAVGYSWGDFGHDLFGGVHTAGKVLATAFGGKAGEELANKAEGAESPILPEWAGGTWKPEAGQPAPGGGPAPARDPNQPEVVVSSPDAIIVVHPGGKKVDVFDGPKAVGLWNGKNRFPGTGYKPGSKTTGMFSFGYRDPGKVTIIFQNDRLYTVTDAQQVMFQGGQEKRSPQMDDVKALGDAIVGEMEGDELDVSAPEGTSKDWVEILGLTGGTTVSETPEPMMLDETTYLLGARPPLKEVPCKSIGRPNEPAGTRCYAHVLGDEDDDLPHRVLPVGPPLVRRNFPREAKVHPTPAMTRFGRRVRRGQQNAYIRGCDVLGVQPFSGNRFLTKKPTRSGFVFKKTPKGRPFTSLRLTPHKLLDHGQVIANARDVSRRAIRIGNKLARISKGKLNQFAQDLIAAGHKLADHANAHERDITTRNAKRKAGQAAAAKKYGGAGIGTVVHGWDMAEDELMAILGSDGADFEESITCGAQCEAEVLGRMALVGDATNYVVPPTDGSTGGDGSSPDQATSPVPGPDSNYGMGPPPDMNSDGVAMVSGQDYIPDPNPIPSTGADPNLYAFDTHGDDSQFPLGCIIYGADFSVPLPLDALGSFTRFLGGAPPDHGGGVSGFEFGHQNVLKNAGIPNWGTSRDWTIFYENGYNDNGYIDNRWGGDNSPSGKERQATSMENGWGPLIGNPNGVSPGPYDAGLDKKPVPTWVQGMYFDPSSLLWFWYWDRAPDWGKRPFLEARLAKAMLAYNAQLTQAKADYANQQMIDRQNQQKAAQQAAQQALEDSQTAHNQQQQEAQLAMEAEKAAQQQELQQQQMAQQQEQLQTQEYQQFLQYAQAHPEEVYQGQIGPDQMAPEGEGDQGGGEDQGLQYEPPPDEGQVDWGD